MIQSSASEVIIAFLVAQGLVGRPSTHPSWPATNGQIPIEGDRWINAKDLTAFLEGKIQRTGETVTKYRVQIQVRSKDYDDADLQARLISHILSPVERVTVVTKSSEQVLLEAVMIVQQPAFLYQEEKNRRQVFSMVVQPTISEVS